jgi:hypothetical protein
MWQNERLGCGDGIAGAGGVYNINIPSEFHVSSIQIFLGETVPILAGQYSIYEFHLSSRPEFSWVKLS